MEKKRYPIGKFLFDKSYDSETTRKNIKEISRLPKALKKLLKKLSSSEYDVSYRKDGWTVRQVVHHLADSHMNAYIRMKLAVTENNPRITPYNEVLWADLPDGKELPVKVSLKLLQGLHTRWEKFLNSLTSEELMKTYFHPGSNRSFTVAEGIALYAWHSNHHLAHIKIVLDGEGVVNAKQKKNHKETQEQIELKNRFVELEKETVKSPDPAPVSNRKGKKRTPEQIAAFRLKRWPEKVALESAIKTIKGKAGRPSKTEAPETAVLAKAKPGRPKVAKTDAPVAVAATKAKPGRPKVAKTDAPVVVAETKAKPGRPKVAKTEAPALVAETKAKPGRPKVAKIDAPALVAETKAKPGRPKVAKTEAPVAIAETKAKPGRPKVAKTDAPALVAETKAKPGRPKVAKAAVETPGEKPKRRGLSAERMAEIRAMRKPKAEITIAAPVEKVKKVKTAKAPTAGNTEAPKRRGLSAERMAEIRAMRKPKTETVAVAPVEKVKKAKKEKAPATNTADAPKRRGLSPERMAEIRAMRKPKTEK